MSNFYWGGGSGTWSSSDTTHWYSDPALTTLAGSVPTASDNVFFSQNATYTVTLDSSATQYCSDFTLDAGTVTFAGVNSTLNIAGSFYVKAGSPSWPVNVNITLSATTTGKTINTNNVAISGSLTFNGSGGGWTLASDLNLTGAGIIVYYGSIDTAGYTVTSPWYYPNVANGGNSSTKTLTLGSSTIYANPNNSSFRRFDISNSNVVLNPGTSTIYVGDTLSPASNYTFYNVIFDYFDDSGEMTLGGSHTFNNLTFNPPSLTWVRVLNITGASNTINGTLSVTATSMINRLFLKASQTCTLTVNTLSAPNCDFQNITLAGAAINTSVTNGGNCGNNSGISFPSTKTVYWNLAGAQNWNATGWCTSSDGGATFSSPSVNNFPLAQDIAIINNNSLGTSLNLNSPYLRSGYNLPSLEFSSRTTPFTLTLSDGSNQSLMNLYGNFRLGTGITISWTYFIYLVFKSDNNVTILSNGRFTNVTTYVRFESVTGNAVYTLEDDLTLSHNNGFGNGGNMYLPSGTLNLNGYTITSTYLTDHTYSGAISTFSRALNFGNGGKYRGLYGGSIVTSSGLIVSGYGSIDIVNGTTSSVIYNDYPNIDLNLLSTSTVSISFANCKFKSINNTTAPLTIDLNAGFGYTLTVRNFNLKGTLGANVTATCSGSTMTVTAVNSGTLTTGMYVIYGTSNSGALNIGSISSQITPLNPGESTGGIGRYTVSAGTTISTPTTMLAANMVSILSNFNHPPISKSSGIVKSNFLQLNYSYVIGGARWYAGRYSINSGNNSGWIWADGPTNSFLPFLSNIPL